MRRATPYLSQDNVLAGTPGGFDGDDSVWGTEVAGHPDGADPAASADSDAIEEGLERNRKARLDEMDMAATPIG